MIGCYLLTSANPYYKGHTYIGFTVDPQRRVRQHNGEITNGAFRTEKKRPWQMVCYVFGFETHHGGLQLEWSWQHPLESKRVCEALKSVRRIGQHHLLKAKLRFLFEHFQTPPWCCAPLHLHFFTDEYYQFLEGFPQLPPQINVTQGTHKQLYEWKARLRKPVIAQLLKTLSNTNKAKCYFCHSIIELKDMILCPSILEYYPCESITINRDKLPKHHPIPVQVLQEQMRQQKEPVAYLMKRNALFGASEQQGRKKKKVAEQKDKMDAEEFLSHQNAFCSLRAHLSCFAKYILLNDFYLPRKNATTILEAFAKKCHKGQAVSFTEEEIKVPRIIPTWAECPICNQIVRWSTVKDFYKALHRGNEQELQRFERNVTDKQNPKRENTQMTYVECTDEIDETCFHFEDSIIEEEQKNNEYSELEASRFKELGIIEISDDDDNATDEKRKEKDSASDGSINSIILDEHILDNSNEDNGTTTIQRVVEHTTTKSMQQPNCARVPKQKNNAEETTQSRYTQKRSHSDTILSSFLHDDFVLMPSRKRSNVAERKDSSHPKESDVIEINESGNEQVVITEQFREETERSIKDRSNEESNSLNISYTSDDLETRIAKRLAMKQHAKEK